MPNNLKLHYQNSPTKLREGNVFSHICLLFCPQERSPCGHYPSCIASHCTVSLGLPGHDPSPQIAQMQPQPPGPCPGPSLTPAQPQSPPFNIIDGSLCPRHQICDPPSSRPLSQTPARHLADITGDMFIWGSHTPPLTLKSDAHRRTYGCIVLECVIVCDAYETEFRNFLYHPENHRGR